MNNIKKLRLLAEKTQMETAKILGVTQHTYSNYELGKTQPDFNSLIKLADYFHTTIDNLLGHEVPYLLDKSILTSKQRELVELLPNMSDRVCEKAIAYIYGLMEGEQDKISTIERYKKKFEWKKREIRIFYLYFSHLI